MNTDTKVVARWDVLWGTPTRSGNSGDYVLFTDHERVEGELERLAYNVETENEFLRHALAASRTEVEGLKKDAERYRWLRNPDTDVGLVIDKVTGEIPYDEGTRTGGYHTYEYRAGEELDTAIDAAMEKGNV